MVIDWNNTAQVGQALFYMGLTFAFFHGYGIGNRMI